MRRSTCTPYSGSAVVVVRSSKRASSLSAPSSATSPTIGVRRAELIERALPAAERGAQQSAVASRARRVRARRHAPSGRALLAARCRSRRARPRAHAPIAVRGFPAAPSTRSDSSRGTATASASRCAARRRCARVRRFRRAPRRRTGCAASGRATTCGACGASNVKASTAAPSVGSAASSAALAPERIGADAGELRGFCQPLHLVMPLRRRRHDDRDACERVCVELSLGPVQRRAQLVGGIGEPCRARHASHGGRHTVLDRRRLAPQDARTALRARGTFRRNPP